MSIWERTRRKSEREDSFGILKYKLEKQRIEKGIKRNDQNELNENKINKLKWNSTM